MLTAVGNVRDVIGPEVIGLDAADQAGIDQALATEQSGTGWLVTGCDGTAATTLFWKVLLGTN